MVYQTLEQKAAYVYRTINRPTGLGPGHVNGNFVQTRFYGDRHTSCHPHYWLQTLLASILSVLTQLTAIKVDRTSRTARLQSIVVLLPLSPQLYESAW